MRSEGSERHKKQNKERNHTGFGKAGENPNDRTKNPKDKNGRARNEQNQRDGGAKNRRNGAEANFDTLIEDDVETVTLIDEEGREHEFFIVASLNLDETEYALLCDEAGEAEIMVFRVVQQDGEMVFESVEDEAEAEEVLATANELFIEEFDC